MHVRDLFTGAYDLLRFVYTLKVCTISNVWWMGLAAYLFLYWKICTYLLFQTGPRYCTNTVICSWLSLCVYRWSRTSAFCYGCIVPVICYRFILPVIGDTQYLNNCDFVQSWSSILPTDDSFKKLITWMTVHSGGLGRVVGMGSSKTLLLMDCVAGHSAIMWKEDSSSSKQSLQE